MNHLRMLLAVIVTLAPSPSLFAEQPGRSNYAGEESRQIKSLSASDIEELRNGRGWGLATSAELNGVPGPAHLLELKKEIALSDDQEREIKLIFDDMKSRAILQGDKLIELERKLDNEFINKPATPQSLRSLLTSIAETRSDLRYIHLFTHLQMLDIVSEQQIKKYNMLRGYAQDTCAAMPSGHDPEMWLKHNHCD